MIIRKSISPICKLCRSIRISFLITWLIQRIDHTPNRSFEYTIYRVITKYSVLFFLIGWIFKAISSRFINLNKIVIKLLLTLFDSIYIRLTIHIQLRGFHIIFVGAQCISYISGSFIYIYIFRPLLIQLIFRFCVLYFLKCILYFCIILFKMLINDLNFIKYLITKSLNFCQCLSSVIASTNPFINK